MSLSLVDANPDPAPYPKDTKSGSFSFDVEVDRLVASDTWALLAPQIRPWALQCWIVSWTQVPCGSWPDNDSVIAARLGCDLNFFRVHRSDIMRGWKRHADGRLYHSVITQKVLSMLLMRTRWASNKRNNRNEQNQDVSKNVSEESPESPRGVSVVSSPSFSFSCSSSAKNYAPNGALSGKGPTPHEIGEILDYLNARTGKSFKLHNGDGKISKNAELVRLRLREHGKDALLAVIDAKCKAWGNSDKMNAYLRPGTLFAAAKCEQYVGELTAAPVVDEVTAWAMRGCEDECV